MPSRDFTNEDLFSSPMMSMHNSTHSSQMNTVGPAMSLRTSCWLLPQNEEQSVFLESPLLTLLISKSRQRQNLRATSNCGLVANPKSCHSAAAAHRAFMFAAEDRR